MAGDQKFEREVGEPQGLSMYCSIPPYGGVSVALQLVGFVGFIVGKSVKQKPTVKLS